MTAFNFGNLKPAFQEKILPFFQEVLEKYPENIHSLYLTGSAITDDFVEDLSDINSLVVLRTMDLKFLEDVAPLGKKYREQGLAAPLVLDLDFLALSLDVFPIEFLNFRLIHRTVYGKDLLAGLQIGDADLKRQCERELKVRLMGLRRGYLAAMGESRLLFRHLVRQFTGYLPVMRGLLRLLGGAPPVNAQDVLAELGSLAGVDTGAFQEMDRLKKNRLTPAPAELEAIFYGFYQATEKLVKVVNDLVAA